MQNIRRKAEIRSEAFWAAALRSERHRILSLLAALFIAVMVSLIREWAADVPGWFGQFLPALVVVAVLFFYEFAFYFYLGRKIRSRQHPPPMVWMVNLIIECAAPSVILYIASEMPRYGAFWALSGPVVLAYFFFIIASTLRLSPRLCVLTGIASAAGYLVVLALLIARHRGTPAADEALPLSIYGTYAAFLLIGGLAAAGVAKLIRRHVIVALEESETRQRFEHDLGIARSIQQGLLPRTRPEVGGFDIAGWSQPADETGGDYYDWQTLPDGRLAVSLADVTGHGIGPALVTAVCRAYARASFPTSREIGELVGHVNNLLVEDLDGGRFVTFAVAVVDGAANQIELISAGHGPVLYFCAADDRVELLEATGLPLGIAEGLEFQPSTRVGMNPGDMLILLTDGFNEWANAKGELFGIDRLKESVRKASELSADAVIKKLHAEVTAFAAGAPQLDDLTAVVIRQKGV